MSNFDDSKDTKDGSTRIPDHSGPDFSCKSGMIHQHTADTNASSAHRDETQIDQNQSPRSPGEVQNHIYKSTAAQARTGHSPKTSDPQATDFVPGFMQSAAAVTHSPHSQIPPSLAEQKKPASAYIAQHGEFNKDEGLIVRQLGKYFKKRPVLRDVSLNVKRGEVVGLLGPNGAGKTTCFYMISGLISADYGDIMLDGQNITELPMYRRARLGIGYLPQEASIFRGLTVEQNIRAILEVVETKRDRREAVLDALLAEFSISHLRRMPSVALSGGERRRLEIARALASQPHFILLDEPLAGIDPIAIQDIRHLIGHLKDRGIGVLITDHNVRETLEIVDRAYILHDGRVLMEGQPADIVRNADVKRVYLGDQFQLEGDRN